jgi:hypothetical protein
VKRRNLLPLCGLAVVFLFGSAKVHAQAATGFENPYYTSGARVAPSTLVPTLRRWYLPQRLYTLYDWRPEQYTNYARDPYQIYNPVALEGVPYYDQYGDYVTRGWQIYNWTEQYPESDGSNIFKDPRFSGWFRNLVIASSHSGQYHTSLMVGDGIRTALTPLTFSKPRFDGLQWDFLSDKYAATVLASRINHTGVIAHSAGDPPISTDPFTNLYAVRTQAQVGDFARVGFTFVNAAHRSTDLPFGENSLQGVLAGPLNADFVRTVSVRIADDSPEDGEGGALVSRWRIFIDGVEHSDDIQPTIEGGLRRRGVIEASGADVVTLTFNLEDFSPSIEDEISDFRQIHHVEIGLVLANDYAVGVTSNKQTNFLGTPVYLPVLRADGNVKDGSNQGYHQFRYGLPTGTRLVGFSLDIDDVGGFSLRGEAVRNYQYRRYPNENIETGQAKATTKAGAYYLTAQKAFYPWNLFGEVFRIDDDYSTSAFIPTSQGEVFYDNENQNIYEFVDDNDDQDELPDWTRKYLGPTANTRFGSNLRTDDAVFPGLDEDNDDISDFNRNFNALPDYVEPFLRFEVDPPEFLFGMDMNNNTIIDRFEDDDEADYPYRKGHAGYNVYGGVELFPGSDLMVGRYGEELLRTSREALGHYLLLTLRKELPERDLDVWFILHPRKVKDTIPDDVLLWVDEPGSTGKSRLVRDELIATDAFINTAYFELHYDRFLPFSAKVKHEIFHRYQKDEKRRDQEFLGFVTKGEYPLEMRGWTLLPRWKQLYDKRVPSLREDIKTEELTEIFSFMLTRQLNQSIRFSTGTEYEIFSNMRSKPDPLPSGWVEDSKTWTLAAQVSNTSAYSGYGITTNFGLQWSRVDEDGSKAASELFSFVTVYAGLGTDR